MQMIDIFLLILKGYGIKSYRYLYFRFYLTRYIIFLGTYMHSENLYTNYKFTL